MSRSLSAFGLALLYVCYCLSVPIDLPEPVANGTLLPIVGLAPLGWSTLAWLVARRERTSVVGTRGPGAELVALTAGLATVFAMPVPWLL